ncbi:hypothetical protein VitviT2T_020512 [Vitis vinifera]|uniref:glycerophosphodiester phosphodiesterase n=1 Tax=Vitis vinifera TaxID=29760 RepID=A0ABY9D4L1_VITVI|nr:hypothetical protein VitviT2T_020512 [Vitis vinifera]
MDIIRQVHPYTYRNENQFLHFNFHQDPYAQYDYWINKIGVDGLFTYFNGTLHDFQEWTSPLSSLKMMVMMMAMLLNCCIRLQL